MIFKTETKNDVYEILMNLNRGRLAVSQANEQIFNILEQQLLSSAKSIPDRSLKDKTKFEQLVSYIKINFKWYIEHSPEYGVIPKILKKAEEIDLENDKITKSLT